jgi:hypothetical protein
MPVKTLAAIILLLLPCRVKCQHEPDQPQEVTDPVGEAPGAPDVSFSSSPGLDSLYRRIAVLEIAKAHTLIASSGFWHRLIPRVSLGGSIGLRDLAFPDAGGAVIIPKDSYRLTFELSLSALLDGSDEARAELHLAETETRFSILIRRQSLALLALERKKMEFSGELTALREELSVRGSAVAYQELLFAQGRADFHALAGARIELIRLRHAVAALEMKVKDLEKRLGGEEPPE